MTNTTSGSLRVQLVHCYTVFAVLVVVVAAAVVASARTSS
jgi:hypothetical protein